MIQLPYGITGFHLHNEPTPPTESLRFFKSYCNEYRKMTKIELLKDENIYKSYYAAKFQLQDGDYYVLLNKQYPFIAFARNVNEIPMSFVDDERLNRHFKKHYQVFREEELKQPFHLSDHPELNQAEKQNIAYWNPQTIGEMVFNWWD